MMGKKEIPKHIQKEMAEFFMRTSAPRILAEREKEKKESEKQNKNSE